jgi:hypothetical protein
MGLARLSTVQDRLRGALAVVLSAWIVGAVDCPSAHADTIIGDGSYSVPDQLPYGVYTAHADPRFDPSVPAECTFSTWNSAGKMIDSDSVGSADTRSVRILAPAVSKFVTHGCTPWIKVG